MTDYNHAYAYRYEVTETWGLEHEGVEVGAVIRDHRYFGRFHEWLIYSIPEAKLIASFKGRFIERVAA